MRELLASSGLEVELDWAPPIYLDPLVGLAMILLAFPLYSRARPLWSHRTRAPVQPARVLPHHPLTD